MADQKWALKGNYFEVCRANGNCPLTFGRDMVDGPCANLATYQITEGQIQGTDMTGVVFMIHGDGIGPKFTDLFPGQKGIAEIAIYIDEKASAEQKKILEPFLSTHLSAVMARKILGVKFVPIEIRDEPGRYIISNPYCRQQMTMTIGKDGKTPIIIENSVTRWTKNVKVYNGEWSFTDYGKKLEFHQTSGQVAEFSFRGDN
ncbi:MAG: DUF1326 domain-containing protein [Deltaproteobacteria bacterium]|nr:DUF1326 domain-containing protein [Deltaproteobacteria bacterium]